MPSSPAASPGSGNSFSDPSLAQFIAQKGRVPGWQGGRRRAYPSVRSRRGAKQDPADASIDTRTDTITFYVTTVSFTVVAIAPGKPDMTFTVAGLTNPVIMVPRGAQVTVRFINNDTDEAHGWLVTDNKPPFEFGQPATPAIAGAYAGIIGDPTAGDDGADTISFTASDTGKLRLHLPHARARSDGHARVIHRPVTKSLTASGGRGRFRVDCPEWDLGPTTDPGGAVPCCAERRHGAWPVVTRRDAR